MAYFEATIAYISYPGFAVIMLDASSMCASIFIKMFY